MFFNKKREQPENTDIQSVWDDETLKGIADYNLFEVIVTSVTVPHRFGYMAPGSALTGRYAVQEEEVHGLLSGSKFTLVSLSFDDRELPEAADPMNPPAIGMWSYNVWGPRDGRKKGAIEVAIADAGRCIRTALANAHQSTLLSGHKYTSLTIFKKKGDGLFTEKDRQKGYSYESRYPVIGLSMRSRYELATLPKWAVPRLDERFSLDDAPRHVI
jgi:hypothetical protein